MRVNDINIEACLCFNLSNYRERPTKKWWQLESCLTNEYLSICSIKAHWRVPSGGEDWRWTGMSVRLGPSFSHLSNSVDLYLAWGVPPARSMGLWQVRWSLVQDQGGLQRNRATTAGLQGCGFAPARPLGGDVLGQETSSVLQAGCKGSFKGFSPSPRGSGPKQTYSVGFLLSQTHHLEAQGLCVPVKQGLASIPWTEISDKHEFWPWEKTVPAQRGEPAELTEERGWGSCTADISSGETEAKGKINLLSVHFPVLAVQRRWDGDKLWVMEVNLYPPEYFNT